MINSDPSLSVKLPLIRCFKPSSPIMHHNDLYVSQASFVKAVIELAGNLPNAPYFINLCRDRYYFSLVFCAVIVKGATNLLPSNRQPEVVVELLKQYQGSVSIFDKSADKVSAQCIDVSKLQFSDGEWADLAVPEIKSDLTAAIAFTSGSTGKPRANEKLWGTLTGTTQMLSHRFFSANSPSVVVATVPSQHMYGLEMTLMMALYGDVIMSTSHPFFPQDIASVLYAQSTTTSLDVVLVTTPVHLRSIFNSGVDMPAVRKVISATAPLTKALAEAIEEKLNSSVEEIYGCTEAGSIATRKTVSEDHWSLLDGMSMRIGGDGPIVSGPQLNGDRQLEDTLEYLGGGVFKFLARSTDMVNVGGKRASLAELTQKIMSIEGVDDAVFFFNEVGGEASRPAALVVASRDERSILALLAEKIDAVFLPRPLKKVAVIPRNETGKPVLSLLKTILDA